MGTMLAFEVCRMWLNTQAQGDAETEKFARLRQWIESTWWEVEQFCAYGSAQQ